MEGMHLHAWVTKTKCVWQSESQLWLFYEMHEYKQFVSRYMYTARSSAMKMKINVEKSSKTSMKYSRRSLCYTRPPESETINNLNMDGQMVEQPNLWGGGDF